VSPKTLVDNPSAPPADTTAGAAFDTAAFDQVVMKTYGRFPIAIARGQGCRVWDTEGREYLDFVAGIATCTLGHGHPVLVSAVPSRPRPCTMFLTSTTFPSRGPWPSGWSAHSCADKAFFCNSGAEANEGAIKLARKYARTQRGIPASGDYHRQRQLPWPHPGHHHRHGAAQVSKEL
jgi:acetylornithine/N-succinyldiaminopimelate aminotransferase